MLSPYHMYLTAAAALILWDFPNCRGLCCLPLLLRRKTWPLLISVALIFASSFPPSAWTQNHHHLRHRRYACSVSSWLDESLIPCLICSHHHCSHHRSICCVDWILEFWHASLLLLLDESSSWGSFCCAAATEGTTVVGSVASGVLASTCFSDSETDSGSTFGCSSESAPSPPK